MCGIAGFSGREDRKVLKSMNEALYHRGPDDHGYYSDGSMNLAMRRLSIVDIKTGKQPVSNEDGTIWVVFNGEIYNHTELRRNLEGRKHLFKTDHSDTEVIVHLYEEYGDAWPEYVNGMFAVAIWDNRAKKLLLYRDRIGKKPLYYALKGSKIIFASEIKAILRHPGISRELDFNALYHYFELKNISGPRTAYAQIKELLPGHFLSWEDGEVKSGSYWAVDFSSPLNDITEEEAASSLLNLLEDAVKIRMRCDAPYGAYLSGGVDSSSVVVLMSKNQSKPIKTFSLGYEDRAVGQFAGKRDDLAYAKDIAKRLGTKHFEYIINAKKFAQEMPGVMAAFDEPFSGTVSTFFLSTLIKRHVKVALSGDGADELFGSYLAHRLASPIENYLNLVKSGKKEWQDMDSHDKILIRPFDNSKQFTFLKGIASSDIFEWRQKLSVFTRSEQERLLSKKFLYAAGYPETKGIYDMQKIGLTAKGMLNKVLEIDQRELLPNQVLAFVDRLSMAHSVEVRCPYLDYRIIEFADKLPGSFKIRDGAIKYIHRKAMEKILPKDIIERPKEGFVQPIYSWMHGSLKGWVKRHLDALPDNFFNKEYIKNITMRLDSGDSGINAKVWNLVCFSLWFDGTGQGNG